QNPFPETAAVGSGARWTSTQDPGFALLSDINPGTAGGQGDDIFAPSSTAPQSTMRSANSNNHNKDGENGLYGDGHAEFENNPFVGIAKDNIYTRHAGGTDPTLSNTGSILTSQY